MQITIPEEQVALERERVRDLYVSKWTIDNITACIMDINVGGIGYGEGDARAKAHKVLGWLKNIVHVDVPERRGE